MGMRLRDSGTARPGDRATRGRGGWEIGRLREEEMEVSEEQVIRK